MPRDAGAICASADLGGPALEPQGAVRPFGGERSAPFLTVVQVSGSGDKGELFLGAAEAHGVMVVLTLDAGEDRST